MRTCKFVRKGLRTQNNSNTHTYPHQQQVYTLYNVPVCCTHPFLQPVVCHSSTTGTKRDAPTPFRTCLLIELQSSLTCDSVLLSYTSNLTYVRRGVGVFCFVPDYPATINITVMQYQRTRFISFKIPFCQTLVVSAIVLCLEGLCIGNPKLAAPSPKNKFRDRLGAALIQMECMSYV